MRRDSRLTHKPHLYIGASAVQCSKFNVHGAAIGANRDGAITA